MLESYLEFIDLFKDGKLQILNNNLNKVIQNYQFLIITELKDLSSDQKQNIIQNIKESQVISINKGKNSEYLIIGFKNFIILIKQINLSFLNDLFKQNPNLIICILSKKIDINSNEIINQFEKYFANDIEIERFDKCLIFQNKMESSINKTWRKIRSCISACLIGESHFKSKHNRNKIIFNSTSNFFSENYKNFFIDPNEYINLKNIGLGNDFRVDLIYHIEKAEFFVLKKLINVRENNKKLINRELSNYSKISHPFLPKFYNWNEKEDFIIIEYINGLTLSEIKRLELKEKEKFTIIFELIIIIEYLHRHHFIFRDLKPDNVIITDYKNIVLIDFDRMLNLDEISDVSKMTFDFSSAFVAKELNNGVFSYEKSDIYSLGMMIYYIMNEEELNIDSKSILSQDLNEIYIKCTDENFSQRPSSLELLVEFYINYYSKILINDFFDTNSSYLNTIFDIPTMKTLRNLRLNPNDPDVQCGIGFIYGDGKYVKRNLNKANQHFRIAASQNHLLSKFILNTITVNSVIFVYEKYDADYADGSINYLINLENQNHSPLANFVLGFIFRNGIYCQKNINKAIQYFTNAADSNFIEAQYTLGHIYCNEKETAQDIQKSIYYYKLASDQNYAPAQFELALFYFEGKFVQQDINESIKYYNKSADQGFPLSLYNLGMIYLEGKYVRKDIPKGIEYIRKSVNKNCRMAQFKLGQIYESGQYFQRDINKAIYYYELAANQNDPLAQFCLAEIYNTGKYGIRNINLAIHYYTLSANQNNVFSQFNLGILYEDGIFVPRDIIKSIHYYELAAAQNFVEAQYNLFNIYFQGKGVKKDINKALYYLKEASNKNYPPAQYNLAVASLNGVNMARDVEKAIYLFTLAANQKFVLAQYNLGTIYFMGKLVKQDINKALQYLVPIANGARFPAAQFIIGNIYINPKYNKYDLNKAIHYFTLSANQNYSRAQFVLSEIYLNNSFGVFDIQKGIHYLTLASYQVFPIALYKLGMFFYEGKYVKRNINKGINLMILAANNNIIQASFSLGFIYHEGKNVKKDMKKSISYYKEASSFYNQYAKNNLGIIYKHSNQLGFSLVYFQEAIRQKDDPLACYNLAHIYFYQKIVDNYIDDSIKLLISPSKKEFNSAKLLLALALIQKVGYNINDIKNEIYLYDSSNKLSASICNLIFELNLNNKENFEKNYELFKNIDFLYNHLTKIIISSDLIKIKQIHTSNNIDEQFYEGFGIIL